MKKVFSDISTIAHMWANKTQDSARTSSSNFFFNTNIIYSYGYHFPIAKHVVNERGEVAVLFTERTYSVTTAKHIRIVWQAAHHLNTIYCFNPESSQEQNLNSWIPTCEHIAANLLRAKKPEKYLSELSHIAARVKRYVDFFSLTIPEKLQVLLNIGNKQDYAQYNEKKIELEKQEQLRQQKELATKHKKELAKWLKLETNKLYTHNGYDYLRLNENRIETTQAVKIPLELGRKIYEKVSDNTLQIGDKILDYEVNEVGSKIKIGCHTFDKKYLLKFGQRVFSA